MKNETREEKLARIRREIEEGQYVTDERLRGACEALINETLVGIMIDDVLRRREP